MVNTVQALLFVFFSTFIWHSKIFNKVSNFVAVEKNEKNVYISNYK